MACSSLRTQKLLPMLALFFFINFNYTILRDTKDTLILTAPNSGAETIPFQGMGCFAFGNCLYVGLLEAQQRDEQTKAFLFYDRFFRLLLRVLCCRTLPVTGCASPMILPIVFRSAPSRVWGTHLHDAQLDVCVFFYIMSELWGVWQPHFSFGDLPMTSPVFLNRSAFILFLA